MKRSGLHVSCRRSRRSELLRESETAISSVDDRRRIVEK